MLPDRAERRPLTTADAPETDSLDIKIPNATDIGDHRLRVLTLSDERDRQLELRDEAWRAGWRAAAACLGDQYEAGYGDGLMVLKSIQHAGVDHLRLELVRWDGRREDFGKPRPGDFKGGSLPLERPGEVYLSGRVVHYGECNRECSAYSPGWYRPAEAVAILMTLPHDYRDAIDRLSRLARSAA